MADAMPAKLKGLQLATFVKRAAQLERFRPIITYWIRFYIVQKILATGLHSADQSCTAYTTDLMEKLEQTKAEHPTEDALLDDTAASAYCEQFALQTFAKGEREMNEDKSSNNTADTLLAASTFLDILSIWKKDADPEIASKTKFAKFHALRILKAIKAGEDPNIGNPVQQNQNQIMSTPILDPDDPEVQNISQGTPLQPLQNPFQAYVESAPDTSVPASPNFPPPNLSTRFTQSSHNHNDVSPISPTESSSRESVTSVGGSCFSRTSASLPTFTAETAAPGLPTAPSVDTDPLTSSLPTGPQAPLMPDPANFYQDPTSPPPLPQQSLNAPNPYTPPPAMFAPSAQASHISPLPILQSDPVSLPPQPFSAPSPQPAFPQPAPQSGSIGVFPPTTQQQFPPQTFQIPYAPSIAPPLQQLSQGPFRNDEDSIMQAQKHAKWAISALNFEDANTAVKELRIALRALGAN